MNEGATIGLVFVWIEFVSLWTLICLYNYVLVKKNELAQKEAAIEMEKVQEENKRKEKEKEEEKKQEDARVVAALDDPVMSALNAKVADLEALN